MHKVQTPLAKLNEEFKLKICKFGGLFMKRFVRSKIYITERLHCWHTDPDLMALTEMVANKKIIEWHMPECCNTIDNKYSRYIAFPTRGAALKYNWLCQQTVGFADYWNFPVTEIEFVYRTDKEANDLVHGGWQYINLVTDADDWILKAFECTNDSKKFKEAHEKKQKNPVFLRPVLFYKSAEEALAGACNKL